MSIRNSEHYEALVRMASSEKLSWDTVLLAGRGIAAYSSAQIWMIDTGKSSVEVMRLADLVIEMGEIVELLPGLWNKHSNGSISDEALYASLKEVVVRLESWPNL